MTGIDPDRFRKHAEECHEQAARNPVDRPAWLRLAEDLIKIAEGLEKLHRENKTCDPCNNVDEQIGDNKGTTMADEHQTNAIIATAILDSVRDHPDHAIDPEEAKVMAKCILDALTDAGLEITLVDQS